MEKATESKRQEKFSQSKVRIVEAKEGQKTMRLKKIGRKKSKKSELFCENAYSKFLLCVEKLLLS